MKWDKAIEFLRKYLLIIWHYIKVGWQKYWQFSWFNRAAHKQSSFGKKTLRLGYTFFAILLLFLFLIETNFLWLFGASPGIKEIKNPKIPIVSKVYSSDNVLIGQYYIEKREPVTFEEIDTNTINALIATEDIRFYKHHGLDFYGLASAVVSTIKGNKRGGSTITNQLAKNLFKTRKNKSKGLFGYIPLVRTLVAKVKEWVIAFKLEFFFSKNEILTMYFNTVDYGNNASGIKSASTFYFSKNPKQLKIEESAVLVGLLKGITKYNPKSNPENAKDRRNVVLRQMTKYGYLDSTKMEKLCLKPMKLKITEIVKDKGIAPYFRSTLEKELHQWCDENNVNVYVDGLQIHTTIDSRVQKYAEQSVAENMQNIQANFKASIGGKYWIDKTIAEQKKELKNQNEKTKMEEEFENLVKQSERYKYLKASDLTDEEAMAEMEKKHATTIIVGGKLKNATISSIDSIKNDFEQMHCGMVSINPKTGEVLAWVGGSNWEQTKFDNVWQARRQVGSTFKPLVYATALEQGMEPCKTMVDKPLKFETKINGKNVTWNPTNSYGGYAGSMTLRQALARSSNTVAVQLAQEVGVKNVVKFAQSCGITSEMEADLSIALGTASVSLFEMVQAYGVFANGGKLKKVRWINKILSNDGELLMDNTNNDEEQAVMSAENAYAMTYLIRGGVEEGGGSARGLHNYGVTVGNEIGGKTGTTNDYRDGWFISMSHDCVSGAWVGGRDMRVHFGSALGQGAKTGLPIVGRYLQLAYNDANCPIKKGKFDRPEDYEKFLYCYIVPDTSVVNDSTLQLADSLFMEMIEDSFDFKELDLNALPVPTPQAVETEQ
ncbi:MAG: transglycosylase domain-containing protein [Flavobacteriales bacterium]|nr:transglycosylase domain-containing protein [Flavobacteriales bacterium]